MHSSISSSTIAPLQQHSRYSIFKRIANLVVVVVGVTVCINMWLISSEQAENWHNKQANQLGQSLSALSAKVLTLSILADDSPMLQAQLTHIVNDPHVSAASLYDNKGRLLADNNSASSVVAAHKLNIDSPLVFVEKIIHQEQIIGYLTVMLEEQAVMAYHSEYQNKLYKQVQMLMALAAIAAIFLTRVFYKVRYRHLIKTSEAKDAN